MRRGLIAAGSTVAGVATVLLLNPTGADLVTAASDSGTSTSTTDDTAATEQTSTYTGEVVQTRWGAVQVAATVTSGSLSGIDVLAMPEGDHHSAQISASAGPTLVEQALATQSAEIDGVSGATYTSDGFRRSLQSALEQAGL